MIEQITQSFKNLSSLEGAQTISYDVSISYASGLLARTLGTLANVLGPLVSAFMSLVFMLLISFYMSLSSDEIREAYPKLIPASYGSVGVPVHLRADNCVEFIARRLRVWLNRLTVKLLFIEPGSLWENDYIESFNGKIKGELLDREIFYSLKEAEILIEQWRIEYNTLRTHSALGYRPPAPKKIIEMTPQFQPLGYHYEWYIFLVSASGIKVPKTGD